MNPQITQMGADRKDKVLMNMHLSLPFLPSGKNGQ